MILIPPAFTNATQYPPPPRTRSPCPERAKPEQMFSALSSEKFLSLILIILVFWASINPATASTAPVQGYIIGADKVSVTHPVLMYYAIDAYASTPEARFISLPIVITNHKAYRLAVSVTGLEQGSVMGCMPEPVWKEIAYEGYWDSLSQPPPPALVLNYGSLTPGIVLDPNLPSGQIEYRLENGVLVNPELGYGESFSLTLTAQHSWPISGQTIIPQTLYFKFTVLS